MIGIARIAGRVGSTTSVANEARIRRRRRPPPLLLSTGPSDTPAATAVDVYDVAMETTASIARDA